MIFTGKYGFHTSLGKLSVQEIPGPVFVRNYNQWYKGATDTFHVGSVRIDDKHASNVGSVDGTFIPLVVEFLGLWTPFAAKTLS